MKKDKKERSKAQKTNAKQERTIKNNKKEIDKKLNPRILKTSPKHQLSTTSPSLSSQHKNKNNNNNNTASSDNNRSSQPCISTNKNSPQSTSMSSTTATNTNLPNSSSVVVVDKNSSNVPFDESPMKTVNAGTTQQQQQQTRQQRPVRANRRASLDPALLSKSAYRSKPMKSNNEQQAPQIMSNIGSSYPNNDGDIELQAPQTNYQVMEDTSAPKKDKKSTSSCVGVDNGNGSDNNDDDDDDNDSISSTPLPFHRCIWNEIWVLVDTLTEYGKEQPLKKKLLSICLWVCSVLVMYDLLFRGSIQNFLYNCILWMSEHYGKAVFAFILLFVVSTLVFVPPTVLIFGAGYAFTEACDSMAFGICAASTACFLGSCIGAILAFLRSKYMMRDLVVLFSLRYPILRALDSALERKGFRIMLLLRLCPLIPFNGFNYLAGITGVSIDEFIYALIGVIPMQVLTVVMGATAETIIHTYYSPETATGQRIGLIVLICTGIAFSVVAIVWTWRLAKKELRQELGVDEEELEQMLAPQIVLSDDSVGDNTSRRRRRHSIFHVAAPTGLSQQQQQQQQQQYRRHSNTNVNNNDKNNGADSALLGSKNDDEEWFWLWSES